MVLFPLYVSFDRDFRPENLAGTWSCRGIQVVWEIMGLNYAVANSVKYKNPKEYFRAGPYFLILT